MAGSMATTDHPARDNRSAQLADRVARAFRRISWQRIELDPDGHGRGVVFGHRHRRASTLTIPLATARELQRRGVRTIVHRER
jgi:hypothetical protein